MSQATEQESFGGTARRTQRRSDDEGQVIDLPPIRLPGKYTLGGIVLAIIVAAVPTLQGGATKSEVAALNSTVASLSASVGALQATIEKLRDERAQTDRAIADIGARLAAVERELSRQHDVKRQ